MGVIEDYLPDPRDEHTAVCGLCGFPLTTIQIAGDFSGTIVNYDEHVTVPCSFCMCHGCLEKLVTYTNEGTDAAFHRVYISAVLTRQAEDALDDIEQQYSTEE